MPFLFPRKRSQLAYESLLGRWHPRPILHRMQMFCYRRALALQMGRPRECPNRCNYSTSKKLEHLRIEHLHVPDELEVQTWLVLQPHVIRGLLLHGLLRFGPNGRLLLQRVPLGGWPRVPQQDVLPLLLVHVPFQRVHPRDAAVLLLPTSSARLRPLHVVGVLLP